MNFGEMQADARRKLNEAAATFWTDQDIQDALNEALEEMADITEYYERQATIDLLAGRTYYDLTSLLPDTFLSPRRAQNTATNRWLTPTSPLDQDQHTYVQWELTYGAPQAHFLRGNWWLGIWPRPNDDVTYKARFYYTAIPPRMSAATDTPGFPQEFHPGIVDIALADLLGQERESTHALQYWTSGMGYADGLKAHVDKRQRIQRTEIL